MNVVSWSSTLVLGMLHALEPGHGKTYLAAVMMGKSWNRRQLLMLISSLISSHFLVLLGLAFVIRSIFGGIQDEEMVHQFAGYMPLFIIGYGGYLTWNYYRLQKKGCLKGSCSCHAHKISSTDAPANSIVAGAIAGLIPCPTALAPLLLAGLDQHFSHVVAYLLIYLLGMSLVMVALILGFQLARPFIMSKLNDVTPRIHPQLFSGLLIMGVGLCYLMIHFTAHSHI